MPQLALAFAVAVAVWWIRKRPQRAVLLLAALLPFHGLLLYFPAGGRLVAWKEGLVLIIVLAAVMSPTTTPTATTHLVYRPPWLVPTLCLVAVAVVSVGVSQRPVYATGFKVMFFYATLAFALWRCPLDERERDRLVTILMVTGTVTALFGVVQQFLGGERLSRLGLQWNTALRTSGGRLRSISTFGQPFPFAFYVTLTLTIGLSVALADPRRRRNKLFLLLSPVVTFGMFTAIVRGAILALAVGLAYLALTRHRALMHLSIVGIVGLMFVPTGLFKVFTSSSSLDQRQAGWAHTVALITEKPLGWGLGSVGAAAEKVYPTGIGAETFGLRLAERQYHPDNQYVGDGLQLGVLGVWFFVLLVRGAYRHARLEARRAGGRDAALANGIAASVLGAAVAALVSNYWEIFPLDAYFWMLLGVLLSISLASSSMPSPSVRVEVAYRPTSDSSLRASPM